MENSAPFLKYYPLLTRREFLLLSASGAAALTLTGCATNPVSGKKMFTLLSEDGEIKIDNQYAPHQISADYGAVQDSALNKYIARVGNELAAKSHRPNAPYSFRAVNASYVNGYAFPGGTIALTRGMMVELQDESELSAVLGHEIGHVCARHAASSYTKGIIASAVVGASAMTVGILTDSNTYASVTAGLGSVTAGGFLAHYSRDNEREADALGMEYAARSGRNPQGTVGVMQILKKLQKEKPNVIERIFATHPMSEERYNNAVELLNSKYASFKNLPTNKERFMDETSTLRKKADVVRNLQKAEEAMAKNKLNDAESFLKEAMQKAPDDYGMLLTYAQFHLTKKEANKAEMLAEEAKNVYPGEPYALYLSGVAKIELKKYEDAYQSFVQYEKILAGNNEITFYQGFAMEGAGKRQIAADCYMRYLQVETGTQHSQYAYRRLVEWGYIKSTLRSSR
jgi:predicted Zn-dependent protease